MNDRVCAGCGYTAVCSCPKPEPPESRACCPTAPDAPHELTEPRRVCTVSACSQYRYELGEFWDESLPFDAWILCNPSTADALQDDPTVRKVRGFARRHGRGGWVIVNVFAFRATNPSALTHPPDLAREGPRNPLFVGPWVGKAAKSGGRVILGWGGALPKKLRPDAYRVASSLGGVPAWCMGITSDGQPRHPLMLAYATPVVPWTAP